MKIFRLLVTLTVINLTLLVVLLAQTQLARAFGDEVPAVLRARALQIVDERGRPRATISVLPPSVHEGVTYPETVLLRLIDANGRPEVKIGASVEGGGVGVVGQTDTTQAALTAQRGEARLKLQEKDGRPLLVKPD